MMKLSLEKTLSLAKTAGTGAGQTWSRRGAQVWRAADQTHWPCTFDQCLSNSGCFNKVEEKKEGKVKLPGKGEATGEAENVECSLENL